MRIPLTPGYTDTQLPLKAQRMVNCYPVVETSEQGKRFIRDIVGVPGFKRWVDVRAGHACRGMFPGENYLYTVFGDKAYKVDSIGALTELGDLNTSTGHVWIESNLGETEIAFCDGTTVYVWDGSTFAEVTDDGLPEVTAMTYQDGYIIVSKKDSGRFHINTTPDDFQNWDANDYDNADIKSDYLVAPYSMLRQLYLFGTRSVEVWYNSGASDFPFDRYQSAYIQDGLKAAAAIVEADNALFYLSTDNQIKRLQGYQPVVASTRVIDRVIANMADVSDCVAFSYNIYGNEQVVFSFPTGGRTFILDVASNAWYERESKPSDGYWTATAHCEFKGMNVVGDRKNGKLYLLDEDYYDEDGEPITFLYHTQELRGSDNLRQVHSLFEAEFETGVGTVAVSDPQAMLRWTDDRGQTWSNELWRSTGPIGTYYTRVRWGRLGATRRRTYEIKITDNVKRRLHGIFLKARGKS